MPEALEAGRYAAGYAAGLIVSVADFVRDSPPEPRRLLPILDETVQAAYRDSIEVGATTTLGIARDFWLLHGRAALGVAEGVPFPFSEFDPIEREPWSFPGDESNIPTPVSVEQQPASALSAPEPSEFEGVLGTIEEAMQVPRREFEALLSRVKGKNYGSLEANQRVASLIQETADRLHLAFACPQCDRPAIFRCDKNRSMPSGKFTFAHSDGTHTGTAAVPELTTCPKPKRARRSKVASEE